MANLEARLKLIADTGQAEARINQTFTRLQRLASRSNVEVTRLPRELRRARTEAEKLCDALEETTKPLDSIGRKLKGLFAAYGGVMTIRAVIQTSDLITGAENKLNTINGGDTNATQEQMDKIYAASQRSRTGYGDMLSNVSKSMTLASNAFAGNIDNAIKFQEIMAKSYAVGGASAAEQASSMYQMIQALGSGRLQGDELRSVTEGAPMAAKAIEKYAQKIYKTTDALKDMGSQGLITSEIVVAAMMNAGDEIEKTFENSNMTIAQSFTMMKNVAIKSFQPIQDKINGFLNSESGQNFLKVATEIIQGIIFVLNVVVSVVLGITRVIVDNWNVLKPIFAAILLVIAIYIGHLILVKAQLIALKVAMILAGVEGVKSGLATFIAWLAVSWPLLLIILLIGVLIGILIHLGVTFGQICGWIVGFIFAAVAVVWNIIVGVITSIMIILMLLGQTFYNIAMLVVNIFMVSVAVIYNTFIGVINAIIQAVYTIFVEPFIGIIEWVLNAANGGFENFGGMIANLIGQIISWFLSLGKIVTKIIDAIFGTNWTGGLESLQSSVLKWGKKENSITLSREAPTIGNRKTYSGAWDSSLFDFDYGSKTSALWSAGQNSMINVGSAWNKGNEIGNNFGNSVTKKIDGLKSKLNTTLPDPNAAENALNTTDPNALIGDDIAKGIKDTAGNTGKMADSMEMAQEDLEYLRKLAEMEWKKEFTVANISVDMKNNNTINNQGDLDGWLGVLSDKLYEELGMVADGVYA